MKRKMLIISAIPPFPQDSGGATRIKNTIKELSKEYQIYFVSFKNKDYQFSTNEHKNLNKWCVKYIFIDYTDYKIPGSYFSFNQPYWFSNWFSPELVIIINTLLKDEDIDLIQIEFSQLLYLADYVHNFYKKETIFVSHDISTISFIRRLTEIKNFVTKFLYFFRALEIYFYEKKYISKYSKVVVVSKNDLTLLKKIVKVKSLEIIPNGIEEINFLNNKFDKNNIKLGFIGSINHSPNKFAISYFIKVIAPKLEKEKVNFTFYIAGKNSQNEIQKLVGESLLIEKSRITNLGFVENKLDFYKKINVLVAPINSGSGTRIKILESLSYGIPVITTIIGGEGLEFKNDHLIIVKNLKKIYFAIIHILNKFPSDFNKLATDLKKYEWKKLFEKSRIC